MLRLLTAAPICLASLAAAAGGPIETNVRNTVPLDGRGLARFPGPNEDAGQGAGPWPEVTLPLDAKAPKVRSKPAVFKTTYQHEPQKRFRLRFTRLSKVQGLPRLEINGKPVGQYRGFYRIAYASELGRPRTCLIPDGLIKPGPSEISIHLEEDTLWRPGYRLGSDEAVPELISVGETYISKVGLSVEKPDEVPTYTFTPQPPGPAPPKIGLLTERFTGENPYPGETRSVTRSQNDNRPR